MYREKEPFESNPKIDHFCIPVWRGLIAAARKRGYFLEGDVEAAFSWNTCAVGEAQARYPELVLKSRWLRPTNTPRDARLRFLGRLFYVTVREGRCTDANDTLTMIEKRLEELDGIK